MGQINCGTYEWPNRFKSCDFAIGPRPSLSLGLLKGLVLNPTYPLRTDLGPPTDRPTARLSSGGRATKIGSWTRRRRRSGPPLLQPEEREKERKAARNERNGPLTVSELVLLAG